MMDSQRLLDDLDPQSAWEPFSPTRRSRWDFIKAAHLLRRAAFGASWAEIQKAVADGPELTIDRLLAGGDGLVEFSTSAEELVDGAVKTGDGAQLEAAWMHRLLNSPHPLLERLTLFWHDHFATSLAKVEDLSLMQRQNDTLRRYALGSFAELLHAMTRDPAMLIWLDSNTNRKDAPNENYAREVFELFSLGLGQYTENDIKEAARALTGWSVQSRAAFFDPAQYDDGEKQVFGQRGRYTSGDVVRLCLGQKACSKFLVRKLFQELISDAARPGDHLIDPLAEDFRQRDYDVAWLVRRMLNSWVFFSEASIRQRVKSPVEFVVGTVKAFQGRLSPSRAAQMTTDLGQKLFYPPSVKGWDGGRLWLNSATLLRRQNMAFELTRGEGAGLRCDPAATAVANSASDPRAMADFFLNLLSQDTRESSRTGLIAKIEDEARLEGLNPLRPRQNRERFARAAAHLVLTMPEYQLG
jgi:hypothetical protein